MRFLTSQRHCFSHGTVLILQSEGWHHRNNIHLAPAKNILSTCKTITKLPLTCAYFLAVEFRVCDGGVQTALDGLYMTVSHGHFREERESNRKEGFQLREGTCIWTNLSHWALQGGAGCRVQHILRDRAWKQWKDSWMCSTTAVWASCWQVLSMAALTCYAALFPFLNAPSRLVALQGTKPIHTPTLFSSVSSRLDMDLCCYLYPRGPEAAPYNPTDLLQSGTDKKAGMQLYPAETAWRI